MIIASDPSSTSGYASASAKFLTDIQEHLEKGDLDWLNQHGKVYDIERLKRDVSSAFANVPFPGDWCLRGSDEGNEPFLLEREFQGKKDWRVLSAEFLDQAPDGFGSALSFFSDEAFRFYLPAYLIADVEGRLERQNPAFHLTFGLTDRGRSESVNERRSGERTWFEEGRHRFAIFDHPQAEAIGSYLRFKADIDEFLRDEIEQALRNYWVERTSSS